MSRYRPVIPALFFIICFILIGLPLMAETEKWTEFRGGDRLGVNSEMSLPVAWQPSDFKWGIALPGVGHSAPVVWEHTIFVSSADDDKNIGYLFAINADDGRIRWQKEFQLTDLKMHTDNSLAAPSPAVDAFRIYVIWYANDRTQLLAFTHQGENVWKTNFDGIQAQHGGGSSLVLTKDLVVFTREQEEGSAFSSAWTAVDKKTGAVVWELPRETSDRNSFSTPFLHRNVSREAQLVFTSYAYGFSGVNPETGKVLWERTGLLTHRIVASPFVAEDFLVGCSKSETLVLKVDPLSGEAADSVLYKLPRNCSPYVPTPIVVNGLLFTFVDNGTVACTRLATGEVLWKEKPAGGIYGSPVCVGGNLYCVTKSGDVVVIRADSTYQLLGVNALGEGSYSTPALCESGMIFRTFSRLMLLGKKER